MLRIASVLLVAVMLTTCIISGAFAKYSVSKSTDAIVAQVSGFGITVSNINITAGEGTDLTLVPGGTGVLATSQITGTPTVNAKVSYSATVSIEGWTVDAAEYFPVALSVNGATYAIGDEYAADTEGDGKITNVDELETVVAEAIAAIDVAQFTAGDAISMEEVTILSWSWAQVDENAAKDTALGEAATAATIEVTITATVDQVS